ncbi:hypothetical protein CVD28_02280 [Bacillus sp. M6-12]|uniref:hypothetical protein n=1 Tax=Bacillus sp. M6-12 TaxID=2054166 RepID=UPI000C7596B3|nr:hypothetical protein [Bacillus sp. M6-12]PLS19260.1 hypothetical protein CVD28_02280 [Bacillus sp. M6-12]
MANLRGNTDDELEDIYREKSGKLRDEAERELRGRGYHYNNGEWMDDEEYEKSLEEDSDTNWFIFKAILVIAGLVAFFVALNYVHLVFYFAYEHMLPIIVGFVASAVLMYVGKGASKSLNFLFYIGLFAISTSLFPLIVEMFENQDYMAFFYESDSLELAKYGFIYVLYVALIPWLLLKIITAIVRSLTEREVKSKTTQKKDSQNPPIK